jgi:hypothetical protein
MVVTGKNLTRDIIIFASDFMCARVSMSLMMNEVLKVENIVGALRVSALTNVARFGAARYAYCPGSMQGILTLSIPRNGCLWDRIRRGAWLTGIRVEDYIVVSDRESSRKSGKSLVPKNWTTLSHFPQSNHVPGQHDARRLCQAP